MDIFCVAQNREGGWEVWCGGAGSHCCNDDTLDGLVHWNENTSRLDRCKSGAAVGVVATGAAEEMKDGPESPVE